MQRITITLDEPLVAEFELYLAKHGYTNRSEAVRDLIRARLDTELLAESPNGHCVANLSYVYNHHERELASRLTRAHHDHHDLAVSTLHVHLDHDHCLETVILRGPAARVRAFAEAVIAQAGVHHGHLSILPVAVDEQHHDHGHGGHAHAHVRPLAGGDA